MTSNAPMSYSSALSSRRDQTQSGQQEARPVSQQAQPPRQSSNRANHPGQNQQPQNQHNHHQQQPSSGAYTRETYTRRADHTPHTSKADEKHYVVSLTTTPDLHHKLTDLRNQHFPKHLNKLQSHLALFRALPGSQLARITSDISSLCSRTQPFELRTASAPFRLRQGVGIKLEGGKEKVVRVFKDLELPWESEGWLSDQDRSFQPHWTVQNKVEDEKVVEKSMREVEGVLKGEGQGGGGLVGKATGLTLFRYEKGYWKFEKSWKFGGKEGPGGEA